MLNDEIREITAQIIDNQISLNKKMDELIKIMSNLTNTIVKYDEQYQNEIVDNLTK